MTGKLLGWPLFHIVTYYHGKVVETREIMGRRKEIAKQTSTPAKDVISRSRRVTVYIPNPTEPAPPAVKDIDNFVGAIKKIS